MACILGRCRRTTKGLLWDGRPTPLPHPLPQKHLKIHGQEPHLPVPTWPFPTRSKSGHRPLCDSYCLTQLFCLTSNQQPGPCCSSSRAAFSPSMTSPCPGSCLPNQVLAWIYLRASRSKLMPLNNSRPPQSCRAETRLSLAHVAQSSKRTTSSASF